jgi:hypothetical protein
MPDSILAGELLLRLSDTIDAQDWAALTDLLAADFEGHYVHTGEDFDRDGFVALNRDYPGSWRFLHEEIVDAGDRAVLRARVTDGRETYYVATFATAAGGRLSSLVEVWTDSVKPPEKEKRPR